MSRRQDDKNDEIGQKKEKQVPVTRIEFVPVNIATQGGQSKHPPKFRDPENPFHTWSGYGPRPKWLRKYIEEEGRSLEDFLIR